MKRSKPTALKKVLAGTIEAISAKREESVSEEDINDIWRQAAGEEAGSHSSPAQIKGSTLVINVDSPIWIYQLNIKREKIERKLNRLIKRDKPLRIRLRAGTR